MQVHVAYQTSGNIAVWDEDALRFADFAVQLQRALGSTDKGFASAGTRIENFLNHKSPGQASYSVSRACGFGLLSRLAQNSEPRDEAYHEQFAALKVQPLP